ncbi:MAG: hypothetical protein HYR68_07390 [Burkholderiales bacterium]|nr:hypothetical protein [Burkholderiales bacterium]
MTRRPLKIESSIMMLSLMRKIASVLLLLCFVLPLSTCASKKMPQQEVQSQSANSQSVQKEVAKDNFLYGYVLLSDGWEDIRKNKTMASGMTVLAVFVVFFLPCGLCLSGDRHKSAVCWQLLVGAACCWLAWSICCAGLCIGCGKEKRRHK